MRIVAGEFCGRRLRPPRRSSGVRPTADRIREAWFNRLGDQVRGARILDLFAGCGALGLEALSRGAREAVFVERARPSLEALSANVEALAVGDRCTIKRTDAIRFVQSLEPNRFDLVFADPPYGTSHAVDLAHAFLSRPFAPIFCVEHASTDVMPAGDTRVYGDAALTFLDAP